MCQTPARVGMKGFLFGDTPGRLTGERDVGGGGGGKYEG